MMFVDERHATHPAAIQVLKFLDEGSYRAASGATVSIRDAQATAEAGTRLYTPEQLETLRQGPPRVAARPMDIEVIDATTSEAALALAKQGGVVLLNFASARNPGGGFLGGARAQEEELCRCGGLYRALLTQATYYQVNRQQHSMLYSDYQIYSPRVPFFRTAATAPLLDEPFFPSVITAPAPNAGALHRNVPAEKDKLRPTFVRRWANVLAAAEDAGQRTVLLGAWGCGAFYNDPGMVAETAREVLGSPRFAGAFERVVFAIPAFSERSRANLAQFRKVLQKPWPGPGTF